MNIKPLQTPDSGKNVDIPRAGRKLDAKAIDAVARLTARGLTESESCRLIGIKPATWFNFKRRASVDARFASAVEQFTAERVDRLLAGIEDCGDGKGMKHPDWRAKAWLLSTSHPKRFSDAATRASVEIGVTVQPIISDAKLKEIGDRIFGSETAKPVEIQAVEVKQIENAKP